MRKGRAILPAALVCVLVAVAFAAHAATRGDGTAEEVRLLLAAARGEAQSGRVVEAVQLYRRAAELDRSNLPARLELARLLARGAGTAAEAEALYREATALTPKDASLAVERANNLVIAGDAVNAILEYRRAFELDPENDAALDAFAEQTALIGGAGAAIERARGRLRKAPGDVATRLLLAEMLFSEGRLNESREQFALARRAAPGGVTALRGIVRACLTAADADCATEGTVALAARSKSFEQARVLRARLLLAAGRTDAALIALGANRVSATEVNDAETLDALADCYRVRGDAGNERAALEKLSLMVGARGFGVLGRLARSRAEAGDVEGARSSVDELLRAEPGNAVGRTGRGLLVTPDESEPAATLKAKLDKEGPEEDDTPPADNKTRPAEDARPLTNLAARRAARARDEGEAWLFWGQPARAVAPLREALNVWPSSPRLHLALGRALLQTGDAEGAIGELTALTSEGGAARADALLLVAQARESLRDPQHALTIYEYVLAQHPSHLPALQGQARAYGQMNRKGRAAAILSTLARLAPEETSIKAQLQSVLDSLGRTARTHPRTTDVAADARANTSGATRSPDGAAGPRASLEPLLDAGDTVRVKILGHDFDAPLKLDGGGRLWLDSKTPFAARCRTAEELREIIAQTLKPTAAGLLEVEVFELQGAPLVVAGAVNSPDSFRVKRPLDLQQSLMLASGTGESAGDVLFVLRGADSCAGDSTRAGTYGTRALTVIAYKRQEADEGTTTPAQPLGAGAVVYVPERDTAFVAGEVANPTTVNVQRGLMLTEAIRLAGGTTGAARRNNVRLSRLLPGGVSYREFILDLDAIEQRQIGDVMLRANDIVEVESEGVNETAMSTFARLLKALASSPAGAPAQGIR